METMSEYEQALIALLLIGFIAVIVNVVIDFVNIFKSLKP